ncbi:hypothetical protein AXW67_31310 [Bradyrhizobium neotropicale]|uniref:Uncharacterized protein n=1 Tax=Bradyrhizobium neotropicale TaxID=1497615 RepID=A0A176YJ09_9BRAD|nr:hypothetical protein AXW67_31310 [Bradyrhizobium neotropicale]
MQIIVGFVAHLVGDARVLPLFAARNAGSDLRQLRATIRSLLLASHVDLHDDGATTVAKFSKKFAAG